MKFYPYWAKGSYTGKTDHWPEITVEAFGWSDTSLEDARQRGCERARKVVEIGLRADRKKEYEYGEAPLREKVVQRVDCEGEEIGIISRNRYGALILNAPRVLFVDIDIPEAIDLPATGLLDALLSMFSPSRLEKRRQAIRDQARARIDHWAAQNPTKHFRLYQTHSGYRLLFVDALYEPTASSTATLMEELGSDRLYRALTTRQECFRARLTPKPWRIDATPPHYEYPAETPQLENMMKEWEQKYHRLSENYSVCRLLKEYGAPCRHPQISRIVQLHDSLTLDEEKPLA